MYIRSMPPVHIALAEGVRLRGSGDAVLPTAGRYLCQVLCEDCNLGKLAIDQTDWRPEGECLPGAAALN